MRHYHKSAYIDKYKAQKIPHTDDIVFCVRVSLKDDDDNNDLST